MQYLRNAQSDFDPVFFYLFVFSSSVTYVKTEKWCLPPPPPPPLALEGGGGKRHFFSFYICDRAAEDEQVEKNRIKIRQCIPEILHAKV